MMSTLTVCLQKPMHERERKQKTGKEEQAERPIQDVLTQILNRSTNSILQIS